MIYLKNLCNQELINKDIEVLASTNLYFIIPILQSASYSFTTESDFLASISLINNKPHITLYMKYADLSLKERLFILAHEAGHFLFMHLFSKTKPNKYAANIAEDAILNTILIKQYARIVQMPRGITGWTLDLLYNKGLIPKHELYKKSLYELNSEDIYNILVKYNSQEQLQSYDLKRIDKHIDLKELDATLKETYKDILQKAEVNFYGTETANFVKSIKVLYPKPLPIQVILNQITNKICDFTRQNRRLKIPDCICPRLYNNKYKIYAMIDVSGSTFYYVPILLSYLLNLNGLEEILLIDTEIKTITKGGKIPEIIIGGGGTDLNPGFQKWAELEKENPYLNFICLTDGMIPELYIGPKYSNVYILTTKYPVNYKKAIKPYVNIFIDSC